MIGSHLGAAMTDASVNRLILDIYEGVNETSPWQTALEALRKTLGASGVTMLYQDPAHRAVEAFAGFSPDVIADYHRRYQYIDPWGLALDPRRLAVGRVVDGRALVSDREVRRSEYFAEFGSRAGSAQSTFCALELEAPRVAMLVVGRGHNQEPFQQRDRDLIGQLAPHFRQAFRLYRRLADSTRTADASAETLDRLPHGVILMNASGHCVFVNAAARDLAKRRDGLTIDGDRLRGSIPAGTRRLDAAIAEALAQTHGSTLAATSSALVLERPSGRSPLRVVVVPVGSRTRIGDLSTAFAAVFVTDPDAAAVDDHALLGRMYGLTDAESRVAARLANGETVNEISSALTISRNTVRWHVKRVLHKAGARTQAQFVSSVLRSPVWVRRLGER